MDDPLDAREEAGDEVAVADVAVDELVAGVGLDVAQVLEVPGVGQLVEVDDADVRVAPEDVADEVAADEAGAPRDEERLAIQICGQPSFLVQS